MEGCNGGSELGDESSSNSTEMKKEKRRTCRQVGLAVSGQTQVTLYPEGLGKDVLGRLQDGTPDVGGAERVTQHLDCQEHLLDRIQICRDHTPAGEQGERVSVA